MKIAVKDFLNEIRSGSFPAKCPYCKNETIYHNNDHGFHKCEHCKKIMSRIDLLPHNKNKKS